LHWSDGSQLLADDFEFSGKRFLAPETKSQFANLLYDIKGARAFHNGQLNESYYVGLKALDPGTLLIELEKPAPYFLQLLANFMPNPRHIVESFGKDWTEPEHIVTNGPFKLEIWKKGDSMLLVKNPDYHGDFTGNIRKVELCLSPDPSTQLALYADNQLDVLDMRFFPIADYEKAVRRFVGEYFSFPWALINYLGFDVRRPPFQDGRVRKAFTLAIDKEMLAGGIQKNSVFPAAGGFIPPGLPGHSPGIGLPFDPDQAKALLVLAGHPNGCGFPSIQALTHLSKNDPVNDYLTAQWQEILDVKITWETVNPGLHLILEHHPPNIFVSHWLGDYPDPDDYLGASQIRNWTGWQDAAFIQLLEETRNTQNQVERLSLFKQADKLLIASAAIIPLTYDRQHLLMKPWVKRYPTSPLFTWFWKDVVIETH
jgi:oligopeptide transport system substrate-binding protein